MDPEIIGEFLKLAPALGKAVEPLIQFAANRKAKGKSVSKEDMDGMFYLLLMGHEASEREVLENMASLQKELLKASQEQTRILRDSRKSLQYLVEQEVKRPGNG